MYSETNKIQTKPWGIVLMVFVVVLLCCTGFNFVSAERIINLGPVLMDKDKSHSFLWAPIIAGLLLVWGVLVFVHRKKTDL